MAANTKGRNAKKRKESYQEHGTRRERDEYGEYKLSRKDRKKLKKAKRRKNLIAILAVEFVLILVLGVCVFGLSKLDKMQNLGIAAGDVGMNEDMDADTAALLKGYTNIALFGIDTREIGDLGAGNRSDTMIIASINNETKEVRLMSVYRDTYLNRADDTYGKCNAAYSKGGPKQAIRTWI